MLKSMFGLGPVVDYAALVKEGAVILDVRSKAEFSGGHVKGSVNIPLGEISQQIKRYPNKEKPIITCCASGMRSGSAKGLLESMGYTKVYNAGAWHSLQQKITN